MSISEYLETKGAIEIMDVRYEVTIPDISNEVMYFVGLFKQSGFQSIMIENKKGKEGYPLDKITFSFKGSTQFNFLEIENYSKDNSVSYYFTLNVDSRIMCKNQAMLLLENIMNMILYGSPINSKKLIKGLMNGTSVSQDDLVILSY